MQLYELLASHRAEFTAKIDSDDISGTARELDRLLRGLHRPYADSADDDEAARAGHVLATVAAAMRVLESVDARLVVPKPASLVKAHRGGLMSTLDRSGAFGLLGVTLVALVGLVVGLTTFSGGALVWLGIVLVVGGLGTARAVRTAQSARTSAPPAESPRASARLVVDSGAVIGRLSEAMIAAEPLLHPAQSQSGAAPAAAEFASDDVAELAQAVLEVGADVPGEITKAIRSLLSRTGVRVVDWDGTNDALFRTQPTGAGAARMLTPALITADGAVVVRQGVLLVPLQ